MLLYLSNFFNRCIIFWLVLVWSLITCSILNKYLFKSILLCPILYNIMYYIYKLLLLLFFNNFCARLNILFKCLNTFCWLVAVPGFCDINFVYSMLVSVLLSLFLDLEMFAYFASSILCGMSFITTYIFRFNLLYFLTVRYDVCLHILYTWSVYDSVFVYV